MSTEKTTLEIIAPTTEEAVERGLEQLGLTEDMVEIEVLDGGSRGLLGLGGRQSRVRLTVKSFETLIDEHEPIFTGDADSEEITIEPSSVHAIDLADLSEEDQQNVKSVRSVVIELLERMRVKADVSARYIEPQDEKDQRVVLVDVEGKDLSILIGRRSETLNALQYITGLIVSKELGRWVPLLIDIQGYRSRRERQLRQLGRRMADQAVQTGRKQTLEPMPANERRIIHLELRDHPQVFTESVGEEPYRKVTIALRNP
ncbi:MAG TPA: RNA-binding cell elongation regulator Jag/EloR [Anaerolineaceae bacterium]|nr:RNA-binding cell elongation regulator Jag/EloR [Anaerolineaceae bacterium]HPD62969.1 RNA-binding cell elongation regulator Jag/EloR [Anaerolineaceae bacterium]HQK05020.1 RNA-binding cell elongation regulator Jag/EloR [Anaerolineaceae bacterium]HRS73952.1 RNA-binding cell elongation regulator Jag/EloR [Anaerolineaceae bacterium]HRT91828.1 RNA-binding cell elongation regulator Jag/EloR [Anaerolineaceae bacterium]